MVDNIKAWLSKPYDDTMSVSGWFVFLGFVALVSLIWAKVIKETLQTLKG